MVHQSQSTLGQRKERKMDGEERSVGEEEEIGKGGKNYSFG